MRSTKKYKSEAFSMWWLFILSLEPNAQYMVIQSTIWGTAFQSQ